MTPSCIPKNGQIPNSFVNLASVQTYSYRNGEGQGQVQDCLFVCVCLPHFRQCLYTLTAAYQLHFLCVCLPRSRYCLYTLTASFSNSESAVAVAATCTGLWNASCENGRQLFRGYGWPGLLTSHPTGTADTSIRGKFVVPANLHIGNMGVAPKFPGRAVNSIPPSVSHTGPSKPPRAIPLSDAGSVKHCQSVSRLARLTRIAAVLWCAGCFGAAAELWWQH